jgi:hypothetical protein
MVKIKKGLSLKQIQEWEAYDKLDPIGTWREDFRMAYLSSTITNLAISVHGKKGAKLTNTIDFMPDWMRDVNAEAEKQSPEEMKLILTALMESTKRKNAIQAKIKAREKKTNG